MNLPVNVIAGYSALDDKGLACQIFCNPTIRSFFSAKVTKDNTEPERSDPASRYLLGHCCLDRIIIVG